MARSWATADTHFGHKRIIEFCNRPWETVEEMDEALISNWNEVVKPEDTVYHLGDFSFRKNGDVAIFRRLNGHKHLVLGNHDAHAKVNGWESVVMYRRPRFSVPVVMFHYPIEEWDLMHRGAIHLYGHVHGRLPLSENRFDVGVDSMVANYYPLDIEELISA